MRYEKDLLGVTIRGGGRYKLHRPCRQSTFEFWSEDPRSLIRRGVGLWLYRAVGEGVVEFSTSYTYEVRWGGIGRWIDRSVFRPLFQRATERSFRRLAERYFPEGASRVAGARGRKPVLFLDGGDWRLRQERAPRSRAPAQAHGSAIAMFASEYQAGPSSHIMTAPRVARATPRKPRASAWRIGRAGASRAAT